MAFCCTVFICTKSYAGIMRHDVDVQDYRDFAENLGRYTVGESHLPVYKKDGSLSGYLDFTVPDFGMVVNTGFSTLVAPSYLASARHNTGYKTVGFGNGAQYGATYTLINRNESALADEDFHLPRLNKVVTDAAPVAVVEKSEIRKGDTSRYTWYTRIGGGTQSQVSDDETERITLSAAYNWVSGGTINANTIDLRETSLRATSYGPDNVLTSPLSIGTMSGDSGSPIMVYDEQDKAWKIAGVLHGGVVDDKITSETSIWEYIPDGYIQNIIAGNTLPDIVDMAGNGSVYWNKDAITQLNTTWSWAGLDAAYAEVAPSAASNAELDATKDLRFNGAGGAIILNAPINMGAGKLQFSNNYTVKPADGLKASWAGGGVEVDAGKEVLWQVNGLAGDALHKIGAGTLHINAEGSNAGSLNVGDGTVILDQRADASGNKQAFSSVTLVSGRPTVVLEDAEQVATSNIFFGYRGGKLDLHGNALSFKKINHTDSGASLVNHNPDRRASLTLTGYESADIALNKFSGSNPRGTPGSIYVYSNPYTKDTEYFQLNTESYWYFPTDKSSTATWTYLGTDLNVVIDSRLGQLNQQVFRGFLGEVDETATNGALDVTLTPENATAITALTGGMNLNGNLTAEQGTLVLSGQPVAHAGGVVIDDDWATSLFKATEISVGKGAAFQVGEYALVEANVVADESANLVFGYNGSGSSEEKSWRCYAVIYQDDAACSQPVRDADSLSLLPASLVVGDVRLANNASLSLGKVNYQGAVTSSGVTQMAMNGDAGWMMTDNSHISTLQADSGATLSMVPAGNWHAKTLSVDSLDASGLRVMLGVKPETLESDLLTIKNSATGGSNLLDVSLLVDAGKPVALVQDLVMIDAPAGTSHDYFTFADSYSGFSVYQPNYQVKDENDRVKWVLEHNQTVQPEEPNPATPDTGTVAPAPGDTTPDTGTVTPAPDNSTPDTGTVTPAPDDTTPDTGTVTPASGDATPDTGTVAPAPDDSTPDTGTVTPAQDDSTPHTGTVTPAQDDVKAETGADTPKPGEKTEAGGQEKAESEASEGQTDTVKKPAFNPEDWFTISDNQPLIQNTRAMLASRQYIFSEAVSQLHNRTDRLRTSPDSSGSWVTVEQRKGRFLGLNARQQTLNLGWDRQDGTQIVGVSASYTQGQVEGEGKGKEDHRLATLGAYYSWQSESGWFADAASSGMYLNQELTLDPALGINGKKRDSLMLAGGLRTGYQFSFANDALMISPFVGVSGGMLSGYSMKGQDADVSLSSGNAWFGNAGIRVQKRGLGAELKNVNLSASLAYQYSPGKNGPTTTLKDRHASRQYDAWSDNRYRANLGIEGAITPDLSVNAKVESSFGGVFKTDYSGLIGLSYHF
uniref:S6 family peptidase n=1 Tax=Pantoea sp. IMH TaxID=1267600 RepID=UPI002100EB90|nr:S6 family peptidase [Pantoea sp. IMH]